MVRSLNRVMVIGLVGRGPEMRYMPNGRPVTSLSVGAARSWVDSDGGQRQETEWFNVVAWDKLAERCKADLTEGDQVYVEGRLQTRSWNTEDGGSRFRSELVAAEMILLGRPSVAEEAADEASDRHEENKGAG